MWGVWTGFTGISTSITKIFKLFDSCYVSMVLKFSLRISSGNGRPYVPVKKIRWGERAKIRLQYRMQLLGAEYIGLGTPVKLMVLFGHGGAEEQGSGTECFTRILRHRQHANLAPQKHTFRCPKNLSSYAGHGFGGTHPLAGARPSFSGCCQSVQWLDSPHQEA